MSGQINLFDPALLKRRDWLALANIVSGAGVLAVLMALVGLLAHFPLPALETQAASGETRLNGLREETVALGQRAVASHPDPRLEQELAAARQLTAARDEVLKALRQRVGSDASPAADYLRGLARQAMTGLWLTGFSWEAAGDSMEIRGRTLDPALVPEYLRRLNREPAFRGHAFAALNVAEGKLDTAGASPANAPPTATKAPFHEFTLVPVKTGEAAEGKAG